MGCKGQGKTRFPRTIIPCQLLWNDKMLYFDPKYSLRVKAHLFLNCRLANR
jgi:hypothetical protein